jgi:hypothetical protein
MSPGAAGTADRLWNRCAAIEAESRAAEDLVHPPHQINIVASKQPQPQITRSGLAHATLVINLSRMIEVKHGAGDEWLVSVQGAVATRHRVRVTKSDLERLAKGRSIEELLRESFEFLLEREPNTSILASFDLTLIGRYFPEYEQEIQTRLRQAP